MARRDARNWSSCTQKMIGLLCLIASILTQHGTSGQRVKVEPEVLSYPGQTVNLRCAFTDATGIQLTMVTWIYEPKDGERINIAVFHPNFDPNYPDSPVKGRVSFTPSPPNLASPSIQISGVRMTDEGKYICEYATYPSGNEQGITFLVMLAKPENSASIVTVVAGSKPAVVARCESLNGRPVAQISWVTTANGNATTVSKPGADNTVTVTSEYRMVPTATDNGKDISCLVAHRTQVKAESFLMKLAVQYAPQVSIVGYDNNWYVGRPNVMLTCQANANPVPTSVAWKTMSGEMPDTVQIKGNELKVLKVDETVNTTFVCEVSNRIGTTRDQVTVMVRGTRLPEKGPTTGTIIGAIIGVILLLAIVGTAIAMYRKHKNNKLNGDGPPKYKPPPPKKITSNANRVNSDHTPVAETRPLQNQYYSTQSAEPVTDLDAYHEDDVDDDGGADERAHYYSAAPSGWDDPGNNEVPPPYMRTDSDPQDYHPGLNVNRGESFVSSAMFV
ncbi:poliovirus receptor-related protein 2 isoform X3 [Stegastes partitus]|uniref:Poliovirus receptor-related protein 2 isoform X3 n=1 Tax=Stegastes partitus TaxID=144197 RepID=A0A9Y4TYR8_9TELE|nr:PREDICTED: poliovirus receptor-related protein 2-like isoform X3 [Stegastes partitus]